MGTKEISGRKVVLDGGRHVFVGKRRGDASLYVEMHNRGYYTHFRISPEAAEVLSGLLAGEPIGEAMNWVKPPEEVWAVVGVDT